VIGLLFFAPFVVSMCTAMTAAFGGFVGLVGMGLVGIYADITPKARNVPVRQTIPLPPSPPVNSQ
jgi:hypothetical protein